MSIAFLGIGSNLGDRQQNIDSALSKLKERKNIEVKEVSRIIETDAVGEPTHPKFLNAVCRIETILYPDELLNALKSVERELGRTKDSASGSRVDRDQQLRLLKECKL